jgi:hypothetical protein
MCPFFNMLLARRCPQQRPQHKVVRSKDRHRDHYTRHREQPRHGVRGLELCQCAIDELYHHLETGLLCSRDGYFKDIVSICTPVSLAYRTLTQIPIRGAEGWK